MGKAGFRDRMGDTAMLLTGLAIGAGAMYIFDPEAGAGRRAAAGQKIVGGGRTVGRSVARKSVHFAHRAWGSLAELGSTLRDRGRKIPDDQLEARVRSQLGHVLSHPGAVQVHAADGELTIRGDVLLGESSELEQRLRKTRGVHKTNIDLTEHAEAEGIPSLQGHSRWHHKTGS